MATSSLELPAAHSPLEDLVRDYVETTGGAWDEVEPQVYDVLLPSAGAAEPDAADREIVRLAFDPEALAEHPGAQLASFGTPFIERLLADAMRRGRSAQFCLLGLNLSPHDLGDRVRRAVTLAPNLELRLQRARPSHFAQAVFWFQATFVCDQKEQEIVPAAIDLHYGRQVRHLNLLLDPSRLAEQPCQPLAEARRSSVAAAYLAARERVVRTLAALANTRSRELNEQLERQIARMSRYYADLTSELEEQARRAEARGEDLAKIGPRREALAREERVRVAELRQKNTLHIELRVLNLAIIQQPKLLLRCTVATGKTSAPLELVWDPLLEVVEAAPCPACQRPGFTFDLTRQGWIVCPACAAAAPVRKR